MKKPRLTSNYWAYFLADYLKHKVSYKRVNDKSLASLLQDSRADSPHQKWVCSFLAKAVENYYYRFDIVHRDLNFSPPEKVYSSWGLTVHTLLNYSFNYTLKLAKRLDVFREFNLKQLVAIMGKSRTTYHKYGQLYKNSKDNKSLAWQCSTNQELLKKVKTQYSPSFLSALLGLIPVKDIRFFQKKYLEAGENTTIPYETFIKKYQTRHLRVNLLVISREDMLNKFHEYKINAIKSPFNSWGIHIQGISDLHKDFDSTERLYEFQDDATQLAVQFVDPRPGTRVLDYCAGYGSKTLGYAVCMNNKGTITAADRNQTLIQEIKLRARAAGISNICTLPHNQLPAPEEVKYDTVIVDVPCSGTGNLAKHPEKRQLFNIKALKELTETQKNLIEEASEYVMPGGCLIYMSSSVLREENEMIIQAFLEKHKNYTLSLTDTARNFPHCVRKKNFLSTIKFIPHMQGIFVAFLQKEPF